MSRDRPNVLLRRPRLLKVKLGRFIDRLNPLSFRLKILPYSMLIPILSMLVFGDVTIE